MIKCLVAGLAFLFLELQVDVHL